MRLLLVVAASALTLPALAGGPERHADNHCFQQVETVVFKCTTTKGKTISICADAQSANVGFIQYRYGKQGAIELQKPDVSADNLGKWTFEEQAMARGMQRTASFLNEGYKYEVFVTEAGMDTAAGVVVSKDGKSLATLTCANQEFQDNLEAIKKAKEAKAAAPSAP